VESGGYIGAVEKPKVARIPYLIQGDDMWSQAWGSRAAVTRGAG